MGGGAGEPGDSATDDGAGVVGDEDAVGWAGVDGGPAGDGAVRGDGGAGDFALGGRERGCRGGVEVGAEFGAAAAEGEAGGERVGLEGFGGGDDAALDMERVEDCGCVDTECDSGEGERGVAAAHVVGLDAADGVGGKGDRDQEGHGVPEWPLWTVQDGEGE